jgi:hypothetical protein
MRIIFDAVHERDGASDIKCKISARTRHVDGRQLALPAEIGTLSSIMRGKVQKGTCFSGARYQLHAFLAGRWIRYFMPGAGT